MLDPPVATKVTARPAATLAALLATAMATLGGAALPACADARAQADPGVLVISESAQSAAFVRNFNPLLEVGDVRWPARHAMYEPLLVFEPIRADYVPWLAEAYHFSPDGLELTFRVRAGVRWSDGAPMTAADVAFTFELLRAHPALDLRGVWQFVASVAAPDARTFVVRFQRPFVPGLYHVAQQPIVPAHVWKDVADPVAFANARPVATGPFTEVTRFSSQAYQVEPNPYYWQAGKPRVRALRFLALPSNEQSNLALLRGELDWAGDFVPSVERIFTARDPAHHHYWFPLVDGTVMLYASTARAPLADARVRKGLSMAIDRERLVKVAMYGYTRPADATGLSDAYRRWRDPAAVAPERDWTRHDVEAARRLLGTAGVRPGLALELIVPVGFSDWVRAALVIRRGLGEAGVDVRVHAIDFNAWLERVETGDFELALGWTDTGPTPYFFYRALMASATVRPLGEHAAENWHRYASPTADVIFARLERPLAPGDEAALYAELERLFVAEAPAIPLFPGPLWGECNSTRFTGFPSRDDPYAPLSPHGAPQTLLVLTTLAPRSAGAGEGPTR